jgi:threonine dehydrogenase-like Zn-dependent dehydrogenase
MTKKQQQAFVVTVSGKHRIDDVTRNLKATGFKVDQVLDAIGVVTGSALSTSVAKLRKIPGVTDVSSDRAIDIGPPGGAIS